jgi:hypothetical protein
MILATAMLFAVPAMAAPDQAAPNTAGPSQAGPNRAATEVGPDYSTHQSPAAEAPPRAVAPNAHGPHHPAPPVMALPPVLSDPAMADQLGRVAGVLTRSVMDLPVGEVEAALEGRVPTRADRRRTVRDSIPDPYLDQRIAEQAAASGRTMQAETKALAASLPAILQAVEGARGEIERAMSNLPDPTYPRR